MALSVMSLIWERADISGNELLILLALGDWAGEDGGDCFPNINTIAQKTRTSRRTVFVILNKLESEGYITRERCEREFRYSQYQINLSRLEDLPPKYRKKQKQPKRAVPVNEFTIQ